MAQITPETYLALQAAIAALERSDAPSDALRQDIALVEEALNAGDGTALVVGEDVQAAMKRILHHTPSENNAQSLQKSAQRFSPSAQEISLRKLYDRLTALQNIPKKKLATPEKLVETLIALRTKGEPGDYALSTLVQALDAGGRLPGGAQPFIRLAGARDLYDRSDILQGISTDDLVTPEKLIAKLVVLRPAIVAEQRAERKGDEIKSYALATLVKALDAGGRLPGGAQPFIRLAGERDLYDRSDILQGISTDDLVTPEKLIAKLVVLRPAIVAEQRAERKGDEIKSYALGTLVQALDAGGRLPGGAQPFPRLASARDLYDRQPLLQSIPDAVIANPERLMRELLARRDRIVLHKWADEGKETAGLPTPADLHALGTLIQALRAGGRLEKKALLKYTAKIGSPLEYFLKRREEIEPVVRTLIRKGIHRGVLNHIKDDRNRFTALNDPMHVLSDVYTRNIIKWGRWFLTDPEVALRSLYGGDEIAFMAIVGHGPFIDAVPGDIRGRLEQAAFNAEDEPILARRKAVAALQEVVDHYLEADDLPEEEEAELFQIWKIVEWNADALVAKTPDPEPDPGATGGNGSTAGSGSPSGNSETNGSDGQQLQEDERHFACFADPTEEEQRLTPEEKLVLMETQTPTTSSTPNTSLPGVAPVTPSPPLPAPRPVALP